MTYLTEIMMTFTSVLHCVEWPTPSSHCSSTGLCRNFTSPEKWKKEGSPHLIISVKRFIKPKNWKFQQLITKPKSRKTEVSIYNPSGFKMISKEKLLRFDDFSCNRTKHYLIVRNKRIWWQNLKLLLLGNRFCY